MTQNVEHTNKMVVDLKTQYEEKITGLQNKIEQQQKEIVQLQELIKLLTYTKEYDC